MLAKDDLDELYGKVPVGDDSKNKTILSLLVKCEPAVFVRLPLSPLLIVVLLQVRGQCAFLTLINFNR
jgi:hypothetical protein